MTITYLPRFNFHHSHCRCGSSGLVQLDSEATEFGIAKQDCTSN